MTIALVGRELVVIVRYGRASGSVVVESEGNDPDQVLVALTKAQAAVLQQAVKVREVRLT